MKNDEQELHPEQLAYAKVLHWSTIAGFITLIITFVAYMSGLLPGYVPMSQLPHLWGLSTEEFIKATNIPTGWGWALGLGKGDFASQIGIAVLSGCSIACILVIMPVYAKAKNRIYLAICALEILVLLASAAGIFSRH
jgi:hypothetical protein